MRPPNKHRTLGVKIRRVWVIERRRERYLFKEIAECLGVSTARARQIYMEAMEDMTRFHICVRTHLGRVQDPGGPRDVWLEFYPPPDPRFDNMAPVALDNEQDVAA